MELTAPRLLPCVTPGNALPFPQRCCILREHDKSDTVGVMFLPNPPAYWPMSKIETVCFDTLYGPLHGCSSLVLFRNDVSVNVDQNPTYLRYVQVLSKMHLKYARQRI